MEIFNISEYFRKAIVKGGHNLTYTKVRLALSGENADINDKDKKALLKVLDENYEQAKKNITKQ